MPPHVLDPCSALGHPSSEVGVTRTMGGSGGAGEGEGRGVFFLVGGVEVGELGREGMDLARGRPNEVRLLKFGGTEK